MRTKEIYILILYKLGKETIIYVATFEKKIKLNILNIGCR
jgi:hypothetical protein